MTNRERIKKIFEDNPEQILLSTDCEFCEANNIVSVKCPLDWGKSITCPFITLESCKQFLDEEVEE